MIQHEQTARSIMMKVRTDLYQVEEVVREMTDFAVKNQVQDAANIKIITRELLLNAVHHGNCNDPARFITCTGELLDLSGIRITVTDEGSGFDYKKLMQEIYANKETQSASGFVLLHNLAGTILFNDTGNSVTIIYSPFQHLEEEIQVEQDGDCTKIHLRTELTADMADDFRKILVRLFDKGDRNFILDFAEVKQVDSICIAVLLSFAKMVADTGKEYMLEITNLSIDLYMLFTMMGFHQFYKMIRNKEQAD